MKVAEMIEILKELPQDEQLKVIVEDMDEQDPIEEGDVLTINDVGGYVRGFRAIRVIKG